MANLSRNRYLINADNKAIEQANRDIRQDIYISNCYYRLPFGKYKGFELCQVPIEYLNYIRTKSNNMGTVIRVGEEIERRMRLGNRPQASSKRPAGSIRSATRS